MELCKKGYLEPEKINLGQRTKINNKVISENKSRKR